MTEESPEHSHCYRMGGNSCLSGDFVGSYWFNHELQIGERIILEDMIHYTTVKTTMFNGLSHPDIILFDQQAEEQLKVLRHFSYEDYESRMG